MRNYRATFTTAAFSTLLVLGIQHYDLDRPQVSAASINSTEQINNTDSFAIRVADYDETVQWYRENLNATIEGEWQVPQNPDAKIAYLNVYGFRIKVLSDAKLPANSSSTLDPEKYQIDTGSLNNAISLTVNNLSAVIDSLEQKGINAVVETAENLHRDQKVALVEDNNGNAIAFVQSI
ncbi:MAG: VOC family protein [Cyanobacteria bacterium P01_A01_bin.40]